MNKIIEYYDKKNCLIQCLDCGFIWRPMVKDYKEIKITDLQCPNGCRVKTGVDQVVKS